MPVTDDEKAAKARDAALQGALNLSKRSSLPKNTNDEERSDSQKENCIYHEQRTEAHAFSRA